MKQPGRRCNILHLDDAIFQPAKIYPLLIGKRSSETHLIFLQSIPWIKNDSKETYEVGTLASLLKLMKENKGFCPDGAQENLRNGKASTCNGALDTIYAKDLYYDD